MVGWSIDRNRPGHITNQTRMRNCCIWRTIAWLLAWICWNHIAQILQILIVKRLNNLVVLHLNRDCRNPRLVIGLVNGITSMYRNLNGGPVFSIS